MIPKHQREAISRHEERLNELLHAAVEELESISGHGLGESDWNEADGTITFLFQDVSLLKRFRQRRVQPSGSAQSGDHAYQSTPERSSCTPPRQEWKVQVGNIQEDTIYQFCISRLTGAIEETSIHEYGTSAVPTGK